MKPSIKPERFTRYQVFLIAIIALIQFTVVLDFMVLSPLGDALMKKLSLDTFQFGMVVSGYAISAFFSGLLAAGFADKFDRKKILLFFYVGFIAGTLFCGLAFNFATLLSARIITGIFGGVISSVSMAIITDSFTVTQRGRVMGFVQMAFAGSQVFGIPISLMLAYRWGWHAPFFMIVIFGALLGVIILLKMKPVNDHLKLQGKENAFVHLWHTLANKNYQVGFLAIAFMSIGGFMLMPFSSAFLINNIHVSEDNLKYVFMLTGISSVIIMPVIGRLSDRINRFTLFVVGSTIAAVMVVIYTNMSVIPLWQVIAINMVLFMGIMSRMVPATALSTSVPELKDRGAYMSINSSLQQLAGGVAALISGLIVTQKTKTSPIEHFDILGYVVAGVIICCIFFVYRMYVYVQAKKQQAGATL